MLHDPTSLQRQGYVDVTFYDLADYNNLSI